MILIFLAIFVLSFHFKEELLKNDSVKIFIIDSEVEAEFLKSPALKIQADISHGSKIAAVIRSQSRAEIRAFSAANITGRIDKNNYLTALKKVKNYAVVHPNQKIIVNISLGFEEKEFQEKIIKEINELKNVILIAAAGNNNREKISYPARFEEVVAVAALENNKKMAASNYGANIDFSASGIIEVTQRHYLPAFNFSRKYKLSGTSFAAPQLTALTADVLSLKPELEIKAALEIIKNTAQKIETPQFAEGKLGAGKIDKFKALTEASSFYFWLQLLLAISLGITLLLFLYLCWQKYSLNGIFIFLVISTIVFLSQPLLLLLYYKLGLVKIILYSFSLVLIYFLALNLLKFYLKSSKNFSLLLKIGPHLNKKLQMRLIKKIRGFLAQNNKQTKKVEKNIISSLLQSYGQKKIIFYLKLAAALRKPPLKIIIKKSLAYKIPAAKIVQELNFEKRKKKEQFKIIAELLSIIFKESYSKKKKAAEIAAEINSPLILIPIKNTLTKRKELQLKNLSLYFLLDIVGAFELKAADFSDLLKAIILQSSSPWLKYHALEAYLKVGINEEDYWQFITEIKAKEKEPVLLALNND